MSNSKDSGEVTQERIDEANSAAMTAWLEETGNPDPNKAYRDMCEAGTLEDFMEV